MAGGDGNQTCEGEHVGVEDEHLSGQISSVVNPSGEQPCVEQGRDKPKRNGEDCARRPRVGPRRFGIQGKSLFTQSSKRMPPRHLVGGWTVRVIVNSAALQAGITKYSHVCTGAQSLSE